MRCLPYGQTLTYWPLRGLLIGLLGEEITKAAVISVFTKTVAEHRKTDAFTRYGKIAQALAAGDYSRLARAIDEAESHHLVVHAARMRIVLAQCTGDRTQLERARSVLQHLGDRQFLHRLEEVEAALREESKL